MGETVSSNSVLDLLRMHYPARYYGLPSADGAKLASALDVWNAMSGTGQEKSIMGLPAASSLVPLTAVQFGRMADATDVGIDPNAANALLYPDRYYARYDTTAAQPTGITGWFDTWRLSGTENLPAAADMVPLTDAQWGSRVTGPQGVAGHALVDYTPPAPVVPLKDQATSELSWIASQASLASAMGEGFTDAMKAFVKAMQAIANGTDVSSTTLPERPEAVMS